jgi:5-methylcytosine-specific restriction endonuclease McrA
MKRLAIFEAAHGLCHLCGLRIQAGDKWEVEHVRAIGLLGEDTVANMAPAHVDCHAIKTKADVANIAKCKRVKAKHHGIRKSPSFRKPEGMKFDWKRGRYVAQKER